MFESQTAHKNNFIYTAAGEKKETQKFNNRAELSVFIIPSSHSNGG